MTRTEEESFLNTENRTINTNKYQYPIDTNAQYWKREEIGNWCTLVFIGIYLKLLYESSIINQTKMQRL